MNVADAMLETLQSLSPAQQAEVLDFAQFLKQKAEQKKAEASEAEAEKSQPATHWSESPFVGMWKDREEMKDSVEWVRQVRKTRWRNS